MEIIDKKKYKLISQDQDIKSFYNSFKKLMPELKKDHLVLDMRKQKLQLDDLLLFLSLSDKHRRNKKSFVIVNKEPDIEQVPEELIVVPSLQEAADIIEMEEIERDLGF